MEQIKVAFRRKLRSKTNYNKRLKLLLSKKPRLVIRKSLTSIYAQIVEYDEKGDKIIAAASSKELNKLGWTFSGSNLPAAYCVGLLIGKKAKAKNIKEAILDMGFVSSVKGNKIYACLKGAVDAGLEVPHSEEIIPAAERISGQHISSYNKKAANISAVVEQLKQKILK